MEPITALATISLLFEMRESVGRVSEGISLSVIIPVKDEEANIGRLFDGVKQVCEESFSRYEIIIVNDGSIDDTGRVCRSFSPLKYVEFDNHYGQTAALDCGFKLASFDFVAAIDGDGQNNPADIPIMLKYLVDNDLDVVCGWRKDRQDSLFRRLLMKLAYVFRQVFLRDRIHDSGCTLKVFRKEALQGLDLVSGQHRFIPAILRGRGAKVGEIVVSHRPREGGESKYRSLSRVSQGLRDIYALKRGSSKKEPVSYVIKEVADY